MTCILPFQEERCVLYIQAWSPFSRGHNRKIPENPRQFEIHLQMYVYVIVLYYYGFQNIDRHKHTGLSELLICSGCFIYMKMWYDCQ